MTFGGSGGFTNPYDKQEQDDDFITKLRKRQEAGAGDPVAQSVQNSPAMPWAPVQDNFQVNRTSINAGGSLPSFGGSRPSSAGGGGGGTDPGGGGGYPYGQMIQQGPYGGGASYPYGQMTQQGPGSGGTEVYSTITYGGAGGGDPMGWTDKQWQDYLASMGL